MYIKVINVIALLFVLVSQSAIALRVQNDPAQNNTYLFIDNAVDNEFFITPGKLDPRFSGSNIWVKYGSSQLSLGYVGYIGWVYYNRYFDLWIDNSPISHPFVGIRCTKQGNTCPASGFIAAEHIDKNGFYHTKSGGGNLYNGAYGAGTLSSTAYNYFRNQTVGAQTTFDLNLCVMDENKDYDYENGQRCKDMPDGGTWRRISLALEKVGHLTLNSTGALADIWVASNGAPSMNLGSDLCQIGVVGSVSGLICKMVSYNFKETKTITTSLSVRMLIDNSALGFTPSYNDVMYSGDAKSWYYNTSSTTYNNIFKNEGDYVYVFLSNTFFRNVLSTGTDLTNQESLFTFAFNNALTPQSGYYQFTPSTRVNIKPKEYGISIISSDASPSPKRAGKIGEDSPIEFSYKVTTSASRQAESITAQVIGDSEEIEGKWWCIFSSPDGKKVPIPAYLAWTSVEGGEVKERNSCGEPPVDMTKAKWVQTAWNANINDGFFFTTTLKLLFPMNDSRSLYTVNGEDWMGTVNASGVVKVTATWVKR